MLCEVSGELKFIALPSVVYNINFYCPYPQWLWIGCPVFWQSQTLPATNLCLTINAPSISIVKTLMPCNRPLKMLAMGGPQEGMISNSEWLQ